MNAIVFGTAAHQPPGVIFGELKFDNSSDAAWMVLEAANDFGDEATIEACRRVIDANLSDTLASQSDLDVISGYFR